jgi:hypothetical protein
LPAPTRCGPVSRWRGRVLELLHFERQHQFNDFQARFALLLRDRAGVDIKRGAYQAWCGDSNVASIHERP